MKLKEIAESLRWELKTPGVPLEAEVKTGYASDLLSDVLAHSLEGDLWVTRQTHLNIVAIAVMRDLCRHSPGERGGAGSGYGGEGPGKDGPDIPDLPPDFRGGGAPLSTGHFGEALKRCWSSLSIFWIWCRTP